VRALRDLEAAMKEGALVPTGVTVGLLRGAMLRSGGARFLIDGFPRAVEQVRPWSGVNRGAATCVRPSIIAMCCTVRRPLHAITVADRCICA